MSSHLYNVQEKTLFSKSQIWQINKDFYHQNGIAAWTDGIVPHNLTNSTLAATTYAELIFAFLLDLEINNKTDEVVYILELGAGHGRLCFNILEHLDQLISDNDCSTKYCYVLSDIVEENLSFFNDHSRLQEYFERGILDISYFDAVESQELILRKSKQSIGVLTLDQPILAIANYFLDSIPNELLFIQNQNVSECSISINSSVDPEGKTAIDLINKMELTYHMSITETPMFENELFNEIITQYTKAEGESYILFPKTALECLANISSLSKSGLLLLTMDKGYKEVHELMGRAKPDLVKHGSFSFWVNFHAISQYCIKNGGRSMLDASTNMSIELGCLFFTKQTFNYPTLEKMYRKHSRQLNLDDLNSMKKLVYKNIANSNLSELLGLLRLSAYDSAIFITLLPRIKQLTKEVSFKQRARLKQTVAHVWNKHYAITKDYDLSFELGGLMYDLGYYHLALDYFKYSTDSFGNKVDVYYSEILCYYQLRQDEMFFKTLSEAKLKFPKTDQFLSLEQLDMS